MTEHSTPDVQHVDIGARRGVDRLRLGYRVWGNGETNVLFIHGNMANKDWVNLAAPHFPTGLTVWAIDWRGCGHSDVPQPEPDYANYTMESHALDMLAALDVLGIADCHLATHSTGGIISTHMLLKDPARFGRVLSLDPVSPRGLNPALLGNWRASFEKMASSRPYTRRIMASSVPTLFEPLFDTGALMSGQELHFAEHTDPAQRELFESTVVQGAFTASDGIRFGTLSNLIREHERYCKDRDASLAGRIGHVDHNHLLLWGEHDQIIPVEDLRWMVQALPRCRLITVPDVGHAMNVERPQLYAGYFATFLGAPPGEQ